MIQWYCAPGYHGDDCSVYCGAQLYDTYYCGEDGSKVCQLGWGGADCETGKDDEHILMFIGTS